MAAEDRPRDENARTTGRPSDRRRYEDAVLAALDFEPELEPDLVARLRSSSAEVDRPGGPIQHRRAPRPAYRIAVLAVVHVVLAVVFAELLADGASGTALALVGVGWLAGTVLIVRTIFRAGTRLRRPAR